MLIPFLIMLREGIEAALIVGLIASYLRQTGRGAWMPVVWVGILLAVAMSLFIGAGLQFASAEFPQKIQELFEAIIGFVAVAVLTSMVFWMRKVSRSIKASLHASVDAALAHTSGQGWALIAMIFFAVAREGVESVFFLLAIFQQSTGSAAPLGALLGVLVAVALGYGIYVGGVKLDLRRFFRWTGVFVLIVAAGILAGALRSLHEAGIWNHLQAIVFDLSDTLPMDSPLGTIFAGFFGYQDAPSLGAVIAYVAFLAVTLFLFLSPPMVRQAALPTNQPNR
ncbi:iron uptake transporter permease EfeU [Hypericibacter sp.]|uniref:iron uptake transporter permease EfeU n=1 Tax=Hypericibacter sp. TaxID=2705401 RepID=UPI003D6D8550